jgi:hypothetical protein
VPIGAGPASPKELLLGLCEEVLGAEQVLSLVPVRFHLAATEDGGVAGDMEVARPDPAQHAHGVVVAPDSVMITQEGDMWHCRVGLVKTRAGSPS